MCENSSNNFCFIQSNIIQIDAIFILQKIMEVKNMQVALIITVIMLVMVTSYQSAQLKDLEQKTLEAFKIVCKKLKAE